MIVAGRIEVTEVVDSSCSLLDEDIFVLLWEGKGFVNSIELRVETRPEDLLRCVNSIIRKVAAATVLASRMYVPPSNTNVVTLRLLSLPKVWLVNDFGRSGLILNNDLI